MWLCCTRWNNSDRWWPIFSSSKATQKNSLVFQGRVGSDLLLNIFFFFFHSVYTLYRIITSSIICLSSSYHCDFMDAPWLTWLVWKALQGEISAFVLGLHVFPSITLHSFPSSSSLEFGQRNKSLWKNLLFSNEKIFLVLSKSRSLCYRTCRLFSHWLSCGSSMFKELLHYWFHFVSQMWRRCETLVVIWELKQQV